MERVLVVGLDEPEFSELRQRVSVKMLHSELLPRIRLERGQLLVERPEVYTAFVPVSRVIFHGIFEDDLPFLTALALWNGPCLPNAHGMMDCRQRLPCLVRALEVTRFGTMLRGYADRSTSLEVDEDTVAKWGEWHCGENKEKFRGSWPAAEPTLFEPFLPGEAVRVHLMGDRAWQIRLTGDDWKKSLHHRDAMFLPLDPDLVEDTRRLQQHFRLEMLAVDYIVTPDGSKHLLEVNHIPNVTVFPEIRSAYLDFVADWLAP
jgi:hypothetical protein